MANRILTEVALVVRACSKTNVLTLPYDATEYVLPDVPGNEWAFALLAAHDGGNGSA